MVPLVRYLVADLFRSQRFFPPVFVFLVAVGVLVGHDPGAALPAYGSLAMVLYPLGVWLAVAIDNAEDPVQRGVTVAAAGGGWPKVAAGLAAVSATAVVLLAALGTAWPALITDRPYRPAEIALGLAAQLACGWTGTAVGMVCARPVLRKLGWSVLAGFGAVVVTFSLGRRVPPVGTILGLLGNQHPDLGSALATIATSFAIAVVLLVVATTIVSVVSHRRG